MCVHVSSSPFISNCRPFWAGKLVELLIIFIGSFVAVEGLQGHGLHFDWLPCRNYEWVGFTRPFLWRQTQGRSSAVGCRPGRLSWLLTKTKHVRLEATLQNVCLFNVNTYRITSIRRRAGRPAGSPQISTLGAQPDPPGIASLWAGYLDIC